MLTILLWGGMATISYAQAPALLSFAGTDFRAIAEFPQAKRDSILRSISYLDQESIAVAGNMSAEHQQQLKTVMYDMLQLMKEVLKDPASLAEVERKAVPLHKKLSAIRGDIAYEENLRILKADYEEDIRRRTKEYEAKNYTTDKQKRIAKRELEQELRDIRRDFEEERARLRKG